VKCHHLSSSVSPSFLSSPGRGLFGDGGDGGDTRSARGLLGTGGRWRTSSSTPDGVLRRCRRCPPLMISRSRRSTGAASSSGRGRSPSPTPVPAAAPRLPRLGSGGDGDGDEDIYFHLSSPQPPHASAPDLLSRRRWRCAWLPARRLRLLLCSLYYCTRQECIRIVR
jgi:hypothetical protein